MRAAVAMVLCACAGCYSPTPPQHSPCIDDDHCPSSQKCIAGYCGGSSTDDGGAGVDAIADAAIPLCEQWHPEHFDPCAIPSPTGDLDLGMGQSPYNLDTDKAELKGKMNQLVSITTMVLPQQGGPDLLVISANQFNVGQGSSLNVAGSRPVLIAAWDRATVDGDISIAAALGTAGPGAGGAVCSGSTGVSGVTGPPGTGGGGGAFQGAGGRGGNVGGLGGAGVGIPAIIRGGCAGGLGGSGNSGVQGPRGAGGGAIQISAFSSITINGLIEAGGGGGGYGRTNLGAAGGGGSGGFVGLDAPSVTIAGTIAANGGGGGGGGSDVAQGSNGTNGRPNASAAAGGPGATTSNIGPCASGANGGADTSLLGVNAGASICGGGGGGGGVGYIVIWSPSPAITGTVSPPASTGP
jgi:hypothetical protein